MSLLATCGGLPRILPSLSPPLPRLLASGFRISRQRKRKLRLVHIDGFPLLREVYCLGWPPVDQRGNGATHTLWRRRSGLKRLILFYHRHRSLVNRSFLPFFIPRKQIGRGKRLATGRQHGRESF
jgi:hypothetical protein